MIVAIAAGMAIYLIKFAFPSVNLCIAFTPYLSIRVLPELSYDADADRGDAREYSPHFPIFKDIKLTVKYHTNPLLSRNRHVEIQG
jgi:hypothetical protein